jgi:hypothetical protein
MLQQFHDFVHARTGRQGCRLAGRIRLLLALVILYDRLVLGLDLRKYFHPATGMLPYRAARFDLYSYCQYSVFRLAPDSWILIVIMYGLGLIHSLLLALGIAPRLNGIGLFFHLVNFYNQNNLIWDAEDEMMKIFLFLLLWLPLDHCTVYDGFGTNSSKKPSLSSTWPMWPFRLWQIYICLIYWGCSVYKWEGKRWRDGTAIYHIAHCTDFYPGIFNPDVLFNRLWFLKLSTYISLFIETVCWNFIWPRATRKIVLALVFLLHIGIELTMTMHVFEWVAMVGWLVFLVDPDATIGSKDAGTSGTKSPTHPRINMWRKLVDTLAFSVFVFVYAVDCAPRGDDLLSLVPVQYRQLVDRYYNQPLVYANDHLTLLRSAQYFGLTRGPWNMYAGDQTAYNVRYEATIRFNGTNNDPADNMATWWSPDFASMSGWEKKLHTRNMNYNEYLYSSEVAPLIALCEHVARLYDGVAHNGDRLDRSVHSVRLVKHWEMSVPPPADLDWFHAPARQPLLTGWEHMYTFFPLTFNFNYMDDSGLKDVYLEGIASSSSDPDPSAGEANPALYASGADIAEPRTTSKEDLPGNEAAARLSENEL